MIHKLDDQVAVCLLLGNTWLLEPLQPQELVDENVLWIQASVGWDLVLHLILAALEVLQWQKALKCSDLMVLQFLAWVLYPLDHAVCGSDPDVCSIVQFHPEWYRTHLFYDLSRHPVFCTPTTLPSVNSFTHWKVSHSGIVIICCNCLWLTLVLTLGRNRSSLVWGLRPRRNSAGQTPPVVVCRVVR